MSTQLIPRKEGKDHAIRTGITMGEKKHQAWLLISYILPVTVSILLWYSSPNDLSLLQVGLALLLLALPWHSYLVWKSGARREIPLFAMVSFAYWLYYAFPLFWGDRILMSGSGLHQVLGERWITLSIILATLGVISLYLGMKLRIRDSRMAKSLDISEKKLSWQYIRLLVLIGCFLSFFEIPAYALGEGGRQAIFILQTTVPMVAFIILFQRYLRRLGTDMDKLLILAFVISRFFGGMASGWLGSFVFFMATCGLIYLVHRRKAPKVIVIAGILCVLFFQVGKEDFRTRYWYEEQQGGTLERVSWWIEASLERWTSVGESTSNVTTKDLIYQSLARVSLLSQTANVMSLTPSYVPYQNGKLYSYLFVSFIPRAIWPGKPSVNDANRFYQVAYGLTTEERLEDVSIAVGFLTEGYINFGWFGVVLIPFLVGIFFQYFQKNWLTQDSGLLMSSLGAVLVCTRFITIESQLGQYLGGLLQQIVLTLAAFLPVMTVTSRLERKQQTAKTALQAASA